MNSKPLGALEQLVMDVLWERGHGTVREVMSHARVEGRAYTTVMTTLSRLHRKGLLNREEDGNAFRYRPCWDRAEHRRRIAQGVVRELLRDKGAGEAVLSAFVDAAEEADEAHLRRLSELVQQRLQAGTLDGGEP